MKNYESPTIESAGGPVIEGNYLYYETTVWHANHSTVDTKYLVFNSVALATIWIEVAVFLLDNPPEGR